MFQRLREDINSVFDRDPAARNVIEVVTTYPGVHAVLFYRLTHALWNMRLKWLARWISGLARWWTGIEIHPAAKIGRRFFIDHGMGVVVGETAEIGDDCTLYHGVTLGGTAWHKGKRHPTLGDDVVVGAGAKVLGPITVGAGARIGSNAVVVKDVPPGATVVGIPGRVVKRQTVPDEHDQRRRNFAKKIGFDAYGTTQDMPDPVANAIDRMLDHIHDMDSKLEILSEALKKAGIEFKDIPLSELKPSELDGPALEESPAGEEKQ